MAANTTIALKALAVSASTLALMATAPAFSQVQEIIVTAQKVEENVQDVPIAIAAVSGERLEQAGVNSLENISVVVPSVTFRKGTTSANSAIVMRGVGTITFSVAAEPSVSTVVDGIVLSRSGQAFIDLVDIERLEVLRGPQGTLFGKNASAGLVNIVSKGGSDTFEAEAIAEYFEGSEYRMRAAIAGPLAETLPRASPASTAASTAISPTSTAIRTATSMAMSITAYAASSIIRAVRPTCASSPTTSKPMTIAAQM